MNICHRRPNQYFRTARNGVAACLLLAAALFGVVPAQAQDVTIDTTLDATGEAVGDPTGATTPLAQQPPLSQQQLYCKQLERQLGPGWQQSANVRDLLPRIEAQMARADQQYRRAQSTAEQADCYDYFLFTKSWRETSQCRQIRQQVEGAQRTIADLDRQRQSAGAAQEHNSRQDTLVAELARYRCGAQYETALQKRPDGATSGVWSDGEGLATGGALPSFGDAFPGTPGSTYRTICVRMCDGYYFPINFATTQESFPNDEQTCQRQCGSPARLYYYPNPGGEVQQAMALDGTPYTALHNAFRYRKELVRSCSCRGPVDGADVTAGTQPLPRDGASAAALQSQAPLAGEGEVDPLTGLLPPVDFGSDPVVPARTAKPGKIRTGKVQVNPGVVISKH